MNKRRLGVVALSVLSLVAFGAAQRGPGTAGVVMPPTTSSQPTQPIETGAGMISGRVLDRGDQSPIPDVPVMVRAIPQPGTPQTGIAGTVIKTNANGEFAVRDIAYGRYTVSASAIGLTRARRLTSSLVPNDILTLSADRPAGAVTILMARTGGISGIVRNKSGVPLAGAPVRLLRSAAVSPSLLWQPLPVVAITDQAGHYRFTNAPAGDYIVGIYYRSSSIPVSVSEEFWKTVQAGSQAMRARFAESGALQPQIPVASIAATIGPDRWTILDSLDQSLPPKVPTQATPFNWTTYHPAASTIAAAQVISLDAGEERSAVDISVRETTGVRVSGKLVGDAAQVAYVGLRLMPAGESDVWRTFPNEIASAVSDAEGRFAFVGVPPGPAVLESVVAVLVTQPPQVPRRATTAWVRRPVDVGSRGISNLDVPIRAPLTLTGRLVLEGGGGPPMQNFRLHAMPTLSQPPQGLTSPPGQFGFTQVIGGRYIFELLPTSNWTLRSVTVGGREVLNKTFEVTDEITDVVVTMSTSVTRVSGTAFTRDGPPLSGVQVVLIPADYRAWIADGRAPGAYRSATTSPTGTYSISGLPPGDYLLVAFAANIANDWQSASALDTLASVAQRIHLDAGKPLTTDIRSPLPDIPKVRGK